MNGGHVNRDVYRTNLQCDGTEFSIKKVCEEPLMTGTKTGH